MFKNHAFQIKLVKTNDAKNEEVQTPVAPIDFEHLTEVAAKRLVVSTLIVISAVTVAAIAKEIVVNKFTN